MIGKIGWIKMLHLWQILFYKEKKENFFKERSECNKLLIQGESRLLYQTDNSFLIDKINSLIKENKKKWNNTDTENVKIIERKKIVEF